MNMIGGVRICTRRQEYVMQIANLFKLNSEEIFSLLIRWKNSID